MKSRLNPDLPVKVTAVPVVISLPTVWTFRAKDPEEGAKIEKNDRKQRFIFLSNLQTIEPGVLAPDKALNT